MKNKNDPDFYELTVSVFESYIKKLDEHKQEMGSMTASMVTLGKQVDHLSQQILVLGEIVGNLNTGTVGPAAMIPFPVQQILERLLTVISIGGEEEAAAQQLITDIGEPEQLSKNDLEKFSEELRLIETRCGLRDRFEAIS